MSKFYGHIELPDVFSKSPFGVSFFWDCIGGRDSLNRRSARQTLKDCCFGTAMTSLWSRLYVLSLSAGPLCCRSIGNLLCMTWVSSLRPVVLVIVVVGAVSGSLVVIIVLLYLVISFFLPSVGSLSPACFSGVLTTKLVFCCTKWKGAISTCLWLTGSP